MSALAAAFSESSHEREATDENSPASISTFGSGRCYAPGRIAGRASAGDGQTTWENRLVPSSSHGVTTIVIGNCGVGFAPCRPDQHDLLIRLMEGVEDIPHPVLADGVPWTWESYPEYLRFLASRQYDMDVCSYLPHAPLRVPLVRCQKHLTSES